ncbi:MAG: hypothetical protein HYW07_20965 [Candidatus Latescibacteria bacterium]|nr:hypothetical protein [Candidatus Latescibacterota bacterium]
MSRSAPRAILLGLFLSAVARGEEIPLHGFAQVNYAMRVAADLPAGWPARERDFLLGDERFQLEYAHASATGGFSTRLDLFHDAVDGAARLDLREAYLDLSAGKLDLRAGRQILTWGTGDLVFINDVFPKDWVALLSGAPLEYLKLGVDALNLNLHPGPFAFQAVLIPFFAPDHTPTPDRLVFFNPFPPGTPAETREPVPKRANLESAFRLYSTYRGYDLAFYAYRGFFRAPGARFDPAAGKATFFYPKLGVYGASLQGALLKGLLALEGGFYDSRDDRNGRDPSIENPHLRFLAGYQRAFGADFTLGLQYYGERLRHYDAYRQTLPPGFPIRDQTRSYLTLRLTQFLKYQTLRLSLFAFYSPTEEDYYAIPEVRYNFSDELWGAIGGNLLGGKRDTSFFGQFDKNDNVYLTLRYGF